jgi:hypothetical protein
LEEELEATLNFMRKTFTSITKLAPQLIIISNSDEEVEITPQLVIKDLSTL